MSSVLTHYNQHLAQHYSWMFGDFDITVENNLHFFKDNEIKPLQNRLSVDLGCGPGFQSLALAQMGFEVKAIDFCRSLLDELNEKKGKLNIETIEDNILNFPLYLKNKPELIVCMGDTITHLNSQEEVFDLLQNVKKSLPEKGKFILSYRELIPLQGAERFIPVKNDPEKILTCFLEYHENFVEVFDVFHLKTGDKWTQQVSSYKKLILPEQWMIEQLQKNDFTISSIQTNRGMKYILAEREG